MINKRFHPKELFDMFKLKDQSDVSKLLTRAIEVFESLEDTIPDVQIKDNQKMTYKTKYKRALDELRKLNNDGGKMKELSDSEKILSSTLNLLIYLRKGDVLETSSGQFNKIADDLIFLDTKLDQEEIVDAMEKRKIIRFPV